MPRLMAILAAVTVMVTACGTDGSTEVTSSPASSAPESPSDVPFGLERCPSEIERPSAPEESYRDEPIYVGNNQPTEELRAWAAGKSGFEELWIDRDHNGWVSLGFSEGVDARQAELEAEFPDVGAVIVPVDLTTAEIEALRNEVQIALQASSASNYGMSGSVSAGGVSVDVPILDEENLAPLAEFADRPVCVTGLDPTDAVPAGPQPTEGDGWRLLGNDLTGDSYRTGVATTAEQYAELWEQAGLTADRPEVDFDDEIVIWFGAVYGSGCEIRLDDVVVDPERQVIHGEFVRPGNEVACNDDANPEAYVVAVERASLPPAPFAVQLDSEDPPSGVPEERTLVTVDLREPGSVATDADLGPDPALFEEAARGNVLTAGGVLEPGFAAPYDLDLGCDFTTLGPFNGIVWSAENKSLDADSPPAPWVEAASEGVVAAELLLAADPPRLTLTAGGHSEDYVPATSDRTGDCP